MITVHNFDGTTFGIYPTVADAMNAVRQYLAEMNDTRTLTVSPGSILFLNGSPVFVLSEHGSF
jgi:hypothetical protein